MYNITYTLLQIILATATLTQNMLNY